jgi:hypothetical protein
MEAGRALAPRRLWFLPDDHPFWDAYFFPALHRSDPKWHHRGFGSYLAAARLRAEHAEREPEREMVELHFIPGWPMAFECTGDDCAYCRVQAAALEAMAKAWRLDDDNGWLG